MKNHLNVNVISYQIRKIILDRSYAAHVGHIGSSLSVVEIIALLYAEILNIKDPRDPDRDRFILSKGHASLALYAALYLKGWLTKSDLDSFCTDATLLGVHPERNLKGIDYSTGSLGQGLSYGVGSALAATLQNSSRRIFVLISDAECNEGSVWESALFSAHRNLSNLIVILDLNGQQAFGYTDEILKMSPMSKYWKAFGWDVCESNGHDSSEMRNIISQLDTSSGPPHIIIAHTVFGKGISFMERQIKWHYLPLSDPEYQQACAELEANQ
jgi:transketolase